MYGQSVVDNQIALIIKWHVRHVQHENQRGLFYLVANCNLINCHLFCFQNCNKCSNKFPKLTLLACYAFILSICPWGINTLLACPAYSSQFSILNAFVMASSISYLPLPILTNHPIYPLLQKSNVIMVSKEIIRLSNQVNDLPEEIRILNRIKHTIEL